MKKPRTKKLGSVDKHNAAKMPFAHLPEAVKSELRAACTACEGQWYAVGTRKWIPLLSHNPHYEFLDQEVYRVKPQPVVTIDVRGGVAYLRGNPRGVTVRIIDHDNDNEKRC